MAGICLPKASPLEHSLLPIERLLVLLQMEVARMLKGQKAEATAIVIKVEEAKSGLNAVLCNYCPNQGIANRKSRLRLVSLLYL